MIKLLKHLGQYFFMIKKVFSIPEKKRVFMRQFSLELEKIGLDIKKNDVRFVEDDWAKKIEWVVEGRFRFSSFPSQHDRI